MLREKVEGNPPATEEPLTSVSTMALEGRGFTEARLAGDVPGFGLGLAGYSTMETDGTAELSETVWAVIFGPAPLRGS